MTIIHWAKFYPPEWGGMERVTADLATGMAAENHASTVIAFARDAGLPADEIREGVRVLRAQLTANPANQPLSPRWVWHCFVTSLRARAIIIHAPNLLAALPLTMLCLLRVFGLGPRVRILVWHSDIVDKGLLGTLLQPVEHLMALLSSHIVATSPPYAAASRVLARHRKKISIIPLGIDPVAEVAQRPALPADLQELIAGRRILLSIGRLVPYKGFDTLVAALPSLDSGLVSVIVGTGPERAALETQARALGMSDRVIFAGSRSAADLDALFRNSELYVMSSCMRSEAFGVVLLEAMSHGLAIVACDIPGSGVPWVAENGCNALTCSPGDAEALAGQINQLSRNPDLAQQLSLAGRSRFVTQFTRSAMVRSYIRLIESVS